MASKPLIIASLLGASIGVPYFVSRSPSAEKETSAPAAGSAAAGATSNAISPTPSTATNPGSSVFADSGLLEGARFHSPEQVLRFDVTKDWVYRHWARKSTGPTDVGLFSVRVPLVMGTQLASLAGSLTYYFNTHGQVEHISFRGRTGDATQLVNFLVRTYEFHRVQAPMGEQVYQVTRRGRAQSELRTRPESVIRSSSPHGSIAVELELARPGSRRYLPPRLPKLDIPQAAAPPLPLPNRGQSAPNSASSASNGPSGGSYLDKLRYATPQEESQVLWKRWPN